MMEQTTQDFLLRHYTAQFRSEGIDIQRYCWNVYDLLLMWLSNNTIWVEQTEILELRGGGWRMDRQFRLETGTWLAPRGTSISIGEHNAAT